MKFSNFVAENDASKVFDGVATREEFIKKFNEIGNYF